MQGLGITCDCTFSVLLRSALCKCVALVLWGCFLICARTVCAPSKLLGIVYYPDAERLTPPPPKKNWVLHGWQDSYSAVG